MNRKSAPILAIDRLRINIDGKGVRTLVCMYGCPLRCKYCLNPHTWNLTEKPKFYTPMELYDKVKIDNLYFQTSDGGITFGGGEPLLNAEFISEFIKIAPKEWKINLETSLNVPLDNLKLCIDDISNFIVDIKSLYEKIYKLYTGGELEQAEQNLRYLMDHIDRKRVTVRVPHILDYTIPQDVAKTIYKLNEYGVVFIDEFKYKIKGSDNKYDE